MAKVFEAYVVTSIVMAVGVRGRICYPPYSSPCPFLICELSVIMFVILIIVSAAVGCYLVMLISDLYDKYKEITRAKEKEKIRKQLKENAKKNAEKRMNQTVAACLKSPWWNIPQQAIIMLDTNVLMEVGKKTSHWCTLLPKLVQARQQKIIIVTEVYEELYGLKKNNEKANEVRSQARKALNYLSKLQKELPNENLKMVLPITPTPREERYADKKLIENMLKANGVYICTFDRDLVTRLVSRDSSGNMKDRVCDLLSFVDSSIYNDDPLFIDQLKMQLDLLKM